MPSSAPRRLKSVAIPDTGTRTSRRGRRAAVAAAAEPERETLRLRVYRALARGLMAGRFQPGEAVTLRTLAARLGTSAMPVREAVSRLIAERALVLLPNRSVIVPRMTRARFTELSRVRQVLEGMATDAAFAHVTPDLIKELAAINEQMKRSLQAQDFHAALAYNVAFHFTLYEAGRTEVLLRLIETLWLQAGPFLALAVTTPGLRWTARYHSALLAALRAGDLKRARRAVEEDVEETLQGLLARPLFDGEAEPGAMRRRAAGSATRGRRSRLPAG